MTAARLAALVLVIATAPAAAHAPIYSGVGLVGGFLHPVSLPAHVLALVGLGLVAGQQTEGRPALLAMFALGLAAGLIAIVLAVGPSSANLVLTAAAVVAGAWAALSHPMPPLVGWPLMSVAGAAIGLDSPPETASIRDANLMLVGTGLGASAALVAIVAGVATLRCHWQRLGVRIIGSWVAASAMLVLALALTR
jgi:urease accessory protein